MDNRLKKYLKAKRQTIGSWLTFTDTAVAEIMAKSGFDWLVVDMEHSPIGISEAQKLIQVVELCGSVPLVRVSANDPVLIKRVMDAGAYGVIIPMINDRASAQLAIDAVKYSPLGTRGVGLARAQGYGGSFDLYRKTVNSQSVVIFQIEHKDAVENIEEIISVKGLDGIMIGPYDMSASYGVPGELDHRSVTVAVKKVAASARRNGIALGIHIVHPDPLKLKRRMGEGFSFIAYGVDMIFLLEESRRAIKSFKAAHSV